MNRPLALLCALLLAVISVSSACFAGSGSQWLTFRLEPAHERGGGQVHADFRSNESGHDNNWSSDFPAAELIGLDIPTFRASGSRPLRFALVREAGRLDCSGNGGESYAHGNCQFTADPRFLALLAGHGIPAPNDENALALMAVNVRRDLIDAISAANYPAPKIDDLIALAALNVDGRYIHDLAAAGYRPQRIDTLIQFKAMNISPDWIRGFVRIGYAQLPADQLVQLKALDITPQFISGYEAVGLHHLSVGTLVQLKAMDITPEFARWAASQHGSVPRPDELVQMKLFGVK